MGDSSDLFNIREYYEKISRTATVLDQLSKEVEKVQGNLKSIDTIRTDVARQDKDIAVFREKIQAQVEANSKAIQTLEEGLKWLRRTVITSMITGALGGLAAFIWNRLG